MAKKKPQVNIDLNAAFEGLASQFKDLNPKEPGQWPMGPKIAAWVGTVVVTLFVGWLLVLSEAHSEWNAEVDREPTLKADYKTKLTQAVNLEDLRKQKEQVQEFVTQLERQLPGKAEMDALLSDINQAGLGRGLQFESFRPGQIVVKDYYAELPIAIKVTGKFHDIGAFAGDVANLSRIVTLHNLTLVPVQGKDAGAGMLSMETTARTYRYLDPNEIAEVKRNAAEKAKKP